RILIGTSIAVAAAALFVVWRLYGSELEELSLVKAHHALTWLQGGGRGTKVSSIANPEKPIEKTGAQQAIAVRERDITTPATTAPPTQHGFAGRADIPAEPNTGATSARGTAAVPQNSPSRMDAPPSQAAERALLPGST